MVGLLALTSLLEAVERRLAHLIVTVFVLLGNAQELMVFNVHAREEHVATMQAGVWQDLRVRQLIGTLPSAAHVLHGTGLDLVFVVFRLLRLLQCDLGLLSLDGRLASLEGWSEIDVARYDAPV